MGQEEELRVLRAKAKLGETLGVHGSIIMIDPDVVAEAVSATRPDLPRGFVVFVANSMSSYIATLSDLQLDRAKRLPEKEYRSAENIARLAASHFMVLVSQTTGPSFDEVARIIAEHAFALSYSSRKETP